MGPLIKVTSEPLQVIRFTKNARLVHSDHIEIERQKAMAQYFAFRSRNGGTGYSADLEYINKINDSFSLKTASARKKQPVYPDTSAVPKAGRSASSPKLRETSSEPLSSADMQALYTIQRGSLELRSAKGELSFIPPLVMTIITQYPDIHFEYTGGFHYVPPREDSGSGNINLFI